MAPGIFAGANTATPALGAAQAAFTGGAVTLPAGTTVEAAVANLSTAFAFSYCISMVLFIVLMKIGPGLARRDVKSAAREFEEAIKGTGGAPLPGAGDEFFGTALPVAVRSYTLQAQAAVGRRLSELRETYPFLSIEGILRAGKMLEARDEVVLQMNDTLAIYGQIPRLVAAGPRIGPEVDVPQLRDIGAETVDVIVNAPAFIDRKLIDLVRDVGHGLYLNAMFRAESRSPSAPTPSCARGTCCA